MLLRSDEEGPYVAVGHSFGGAIAQLFADRYQREVKGIVLVDPAPAAFLSVPRSRLYRIAGKRRVERYLERGAREGDRVIDIEMLGKQLLAAGTLGGLPLVLLTRGRMPSESTPAFEDLWSELQRQEAGLSSNSVHVVAAVAGHGVPSEQPNLVVRAIRGVLAAARTRSRLPSCGEFRPYGGRCPA